MLFTYAVLFPLLLTMQISACIPGQSWSAGIPVCYYRAGWQAQNGQGSGTCSWENGLHIFLPTFQVCPSAHLSQRQCSRVGVIIALVWRARGTSWGKEQLQHSACPGGWRSPWNWRNCSGKSFPLSGCAWIWPWGLLLVLKGSEPILTLDRGMSGLGVTERTLYCLETGICTTVEWGILFPFVVSKAVRSHFTHRTQTSH